MYFFSLCFGGFCLAIDKLGVRSALVGVSDLVRAFWFFEFNSLPFAVGKYDYG